MGDIRIEILALEGVIFFVFPSQRPVQSVVVMLEHNLEWSEEAFSVIVDWLSSLCHLDYIKPKFSSLSKDISLSKGANWR
jgi:hypothetical protein